MVYLIDANCFIEPYQRYYSFDICPGFWEWLYRQNQAGIVHSIDKVRNELLSYGDDLSTWASQQDDSFFLTADASVMQNYAQVSAFVSSSTQYYEAAKASFLNGICADPFLIAHAMTHGHIIVTHEVVRNEAKARVTLPTIGNHFNVTCLPLDNVLKSNGARFILA